MSKRAAAGEGGEVTRRRIATCCALALALICACSVGAVAEALVFDIRVEHQSVPDTMRLIRVKQGDAVRLRWTTDQPLVVHLHGYDIEKRLVPGSVIELAFTAHATGRFPIHIHASGGSAAAHAHEDAPLVTVEVYPR
jgi:hypothetical protein